jgi:hypothetical protein
MPAPASVRRGLPRMSHRAAAEPIHSIGPRPGRRLFIGAVLAMIAVLIVALIWDAVAADEVRRGYDQMAKRA